MAAKRWFRANRFGVTPTSAFEPLHQMRSAHTGCHAQVTDGHRTAGVGYDGACVPDERETRCLAQLSYEFVFEQRQHLVRPGRGG